MNSLECTVCGRRHRGNVLCIWQRLCSTMASKPQSMKDKDKLGFTQMRRKAAGWHVINSLRIYAYTSHTANEGQSLEINSEQTVSRIDSCMYNVLEWITFQLQAAMHGADFGSTTVPWDSSVLEAFSYSLLLDGGSPVPELQQLSTGPAMLHHQRKMLWQRLQWLSSPKLASPVLMTCYCWKQGLSVRHLRGYTQVNTVRLKPGPWSE